MNNTPADRQANQGNQQQFVRDSVAKHANRYNYSYIQNTNNLPVPTLTPKQTNNIRNILSNTIPQ